MNVEGVFHALVNLGATWVLWVLVGLSVIAVAVILERLVFFSSTRVRAEALRVQMNRALDKRDRLTLKRRLDENPSMEARLIATLVSATHPEEAEERLSAESGLQRLRAEKNLAFLGTLGNNAPFVGLLGTVVGIIGAFAELDASGGRLSTGLMAEIGEALVATAVGLLVALPAVAAFNFFQRIISVRLARGEAMAREMIARLHLAASEPDSRTRAARAEAAITQEAS